MYGYKQKNIQNVVIQDNSRLVVLGIVISPVFCFFTRIVLPGMQSLLGDQVSYLSRKWLVILDPSCHYCTVTTSCQACWQCSMQVPALGKTIDVPFAVIYQWKNMKYKRLSKKLSFIGHQFQNTNSGKLGICCHFGYQQEEISIQLPCGIISICQFSLSKIRMDNCPNDMLTLTSVTRYHAGSLYTMLTVTNIETLI